jgi:hypothetical protein
MVRILLPPALQRRVCCELDQLPLRADRVERSQQQGAYQPLRRDRLPADRRIQLSKLAGKRFPYWRSRESPTADERAALGCIEVALTEGNGAG